MAQIRSFQNVYSFADNWKKLTIFGVGVKSPRVGLCWATMTRLSVFRSPNASVSTEVTMIPVLQRPCRPLQASSSAHFIPIDFEPGAYRYRIQGLTLRDIPLTIRPIRQFEISGCYCLRCFCFHIRSIRTYCSSGVWMLLHF